MSNLSSIHHIKFDRLYDLTKNYNKATLLDKLIYWWQISTYTLEDGNIWFTRKIPQIASDSKIAERSVSRYLKEFEAQGYIERKNMLLVKKHLYIRITDKLLSLLQVNKQKDDVGTAIKEEEGGDKSIGKSLFLNQSGGIDHAKMAVSIYKEQDNKISVNNNTVSNSLFVNKSKTQDQSKINSIYPSYEIENLIGDRLSIREKNYIKGMMHNLQKQHGLSFSNPEQLFAEIVFTVLQEHQLQGIENFNHQIQIIAKLLRQKVWRTPKGFYNHADFGAAFKNVCLNSTQQKKELIPSKFEFEHKKLNLIKQFDEITRLIHSDLKPFNESISNLKNKPNTIRLTNSIMGSLIQSHQQQINLLNDIHQLDDSIQNSAFVSQYDLIQEKARQLTVLRQLEEQIRDLAEAAFDAFCLVSKTENLREEADITYSRYETSMGIVAEVEQLINEREDYFDYAKVHLVASF